jgi:O-antigen ligase
LTYDLSRAEHQDTEAALAAARGSPTSALRRRVPPIALFALVTSFYLLPSNREVNNLFYFVVLPLTLACARQADYLRFWRDPVLRAVLIFVGYLCITATWSGVWEDAGEAVGHAFCVLVFLLLIGVARDRMPLDAALIRWLAVITGAHAIVVAVAWYSSHALGERMLGLGRLDQPLQLAAIQASVGALAGVAFMADSRRRSAWLAIVPAVCALSILLSASRGPLIALAAVILAAALLLRTTRALVMSALIVAVSAGALLVEQSLLGVLSERGLSFRPEIWSAAWTRIEDAWLLGHGLGSATTVMTTGGAEFRNLHSLILMVWYYGGIFAVALLVLMVGTTAYRGYRHAPAWPWLAAFAAALLCELPNGDTPLIHPHPVWLYLWLPLAMVATPLGGSSE